MMQVSLILGLAVLGITACQGPNLAPVTRAEYELLRRPHDQYRVHSGETLSEISKRTGHRVQELVALNHLSPPYVLFPGQILQLVPKQTKVRRKKLQKKKMALQLAQVKQVKLVKPSKPVNLKLKSSTKFQSDLKRVNRVAQSKRQEKKLDWHAPLAGRVVEKFHPNKKCGHYHFKSTRHARVSGSIRHCRV